MHTVRPPNIKLFWIALNWENLSFIASSPSLLFCFPFGSGVQRHHKVLWESEAAQTLPAHPVQITLLRDVWKSLKANAMKMEEQGDLSFCFTEAKTSTENINGMEFFFFFFPHFIYLFPFKKEKKRKTEEKEEKENPLPNRCCIETWQVFPFINLGDRMQQNMVMEGRSQRFIESHATGPERSGTAP